MFVDLPAIVVFLCSFFYAFHLFTSTKVLDSYFNATFMATLIKKTNKQKNQHKHLCSKLVTAFIKLQYLLLLSILLSNWKNA